MSDFVVAMGPIVFFWCVPLLPLIYTAIASTVETAVAVARPTPQQSRNAKRPPEGGRSHGWS